MGKSRGHWAPKRANATGVKFEFGPMDLAPWHHKWAKFLKFKNLYCNGQTPQAVGPKMGKSPGVKFEFGPMDVSLAPKMGKSPQIKKCVLQWAKAPGVKFEFGPRGLVPLAPAETGKRKYVAPWSAGSQN
jgi:hypothetical protein